MDFENYIPARHGEGKIVRYQIAYAEFCRNTLSKYYLRNFNVVIEHFRRLFPKKKDPRKVTRLNAHDYVQARLKEVSNSTVVYEVSMLAGFWHWLGNQDFVTINPWKKILLS